jgi:hypothetical protein
MDGFKELEQELQCSQKVGIKNGKKYPANKEMNEIGGFLAVSIIMGVVLVIYDI